MSSNSVKSKILIVDDQPDNIWPLTRHLQPIFDVLCSTTGEEALEISFSEKPPDLILLDIMMPGMDGYEVCRKLKADDRTRDIPVIFLTGKTAELEQIKGLDLGAQDYITKPISPPVVSARIKSVLNVKKEMERRLLLKAQLENLNQQLERQVLEKQRELETARQALKQYEEKWRLLFNKKGAQEGPKRILLVDDNPENVHILVKNLQDQYEIICTASGKETLEIALSDNQPDLILLDIMMPEMDGFEVCARLKADAETWDIPVIFVTALDQEVDETKGLLLGAVDFVTKPFSIPVVKARIKAALRLKEEMEHRITLARKLEKLNKNLEERIREKSAALEQAYDDLKASERKYRSIYENAIEGVFQTSLEGRLLDANPSLAQILGYASSKEIVSTITDAAHQLYLNPRDRDAFIQVLEQKGQIAGFETQFKKKSGDVIWVMNSAKAIRDENGEISYLQGFTVDITERKQTVEELRKHRDRLEELVNERTAELSEAKDQAEAANAAKSDFLARMSHEIRTPLNAVTGLTNIVLKSELTAEQRDYLNKVQIASNNLLEVINDILDFSKIEAGRLELGLHPFDLGQVLEQLADLFSNRVAKKDLELIFDIPRQVPRRLTGDSARLTQVITNLVENAVKFTEEGEIVVGVKLDDRPEKPPGQTVLSFSVSDTGTGIPADVLPTLFDPFVQAEGYITRRHEGTGLGLAICHRLVKLMGGEIWAESTPGKGSTFSFTVTLTAQKEGKSRLSLPVDLHGLKALVVDDSATSRQVLFELLDSFTFNVSAVDNGEKAIAAINRTATDEPYRLVLLDWKMPGMDGIETARRIRALETRHSKTGSRKPGTPIIILVTAYGRELVQANMDKAAVDTLLLKPIKASELFNTIMTLFNRTEAVVPRIKVNKSKRLDHLSGRRILVVEDSDLSRDVAVALLEGAGLTVEVAANGRAAADKVTESPKDYYDAILMDIQMPVMNGYEATKRIRAWELKVSRRRRDSGFNVQDEASGISTGRSPTVDDRLPIIALTAHALKGEKEKCLAADMDDYLAKPIDEQDLHRVLLKWIGS